MPLTRSFKEFVKSRIEQDVKFRQALFQEAVQALIDRAVIGKAVLSDSYRTQSPPRQDPQ